MFFRQGSKALEQKDVDAQVRSRFQGKSISLLNSDHIAGLFIVLATESGRFKHDDKTRFEQIVENGRLKNVRMYCTDNPGWLIRALGRNLDYNDLNKNEDLYFIDFDADSLQNLKWSALIDKFSNYSLGKLKSAHFETLAKIDELLVEEEGYLQPHCFEQRLADFIPGKNTDGPLDTIMVKFTLNPASRRSVLKTMDDFNKYVGRLKNRLGNDNFDRLVKRYGAAATGYDEKTGTAKVVYIEFKANELAKELKLSHSKPNLSRPM